MASASKAEEPQGSGGSNPSRCVFLAESIILAFCFLFIKILPAKQPEGSSFFEYVLNLSETYWSAFSVYFVKVNPPSFYQYQYMTFQKKGFSSFLLLLLMLKAFHCSAFLL